LNLLLVLGYAFPQQIMRPSKRKAGLFLPKHIDRLILNEAQGEQGKNRAGKTKCEMALPYLELHVNNKKIKSVQR